MTEQTETWIKLELMGHRVLVGKVVPSTLVPGLLRIDVVDPSGNVTETQEYGAAAIYGLTHISREVALTLARRFNSPPVTAWDVQPLVEARLKALAAPVGDDDPSDDEIDRRLMPDIEYSDDYSPDPATLF